MPIFRELAQRRPPVWLVCAALVFAAACAAALWVFRAEALAVAQHVMERVRSAGPWVYFGAMAALPLPLASFTIVAGELFAAQLTVAGVVAAAMAAVVVQLSLSYAAARYALRPWVAGWVERRGYKVPRVTRENAAGVVLLVRLLPGAPMIVGSSLLALAETPFAVYITFSSLVVFPWVCAGVVFGRGILNGNVALAAAGAGLIVALVIGVRLLKKRWAKPIVE